MPDFYNIPFRFEDILKRVPRDEYRCSLDKSINQNISLIISTKMNEFRFDPTYGCKLWDVDFIVPSDLNIWKEEIKETLKEAILQYEYRIEEIIDFKIDVRKDLQKKYGGSQIMDFKIHGSIKSTSKQFEYVDTLFFSPYSR